MTKRQLPAMPSTHLRNGVNSDIAPSALSKWNAEIRAADEGGNNVISILDAIGQDFFGNGVTAKRISAALRSIGDQEVVVHINSPGGDFFEGLAIYNLLRDHKQKITVKVLGIAASAASIIAMAGDKIEVPAAGFLMIHNTWVFSMGDRHDFRELADLLEPFDKAAASVYAARSGVSQKEIGKMMDKETWIAGDEAVEKGFADALLPADRVAKGARNEIDGPSALQRIDVLLAKAGAPRAERRRLLAELKSGTPSATEDAMQNAGGDDLEATRLRLTGIQINQ